MANAFPKEIRIAFDEALEAFDDALVVAGNVSVYKMPDVEAERANNTVWRPQPYIMQSFSGSDQTSNFRPQTQLVVPARLSSREVVPWTLTDTELRDMIQEGGLKEAATQKLASQINLSLSDVAALQGSLVVKRTVAASGFDDVAQCDTIFNEQGIKRNDRKLILNSRDYNGMASNLQVASRSFDGKKSVDAYEDAFVGRVSGFDTFKADYAYSLQAANGGGGITINTTDASGQYFTPTAYTAGSGGVLSPTDNRFQQVTVSSTTNVVAGDAFTIATLNAVHHITKRSTGQLKTFRVVSVDSSTTMTITPPIITNQLGTSDAAAQYQNCTIGTKASNSAIVFLNTVAAQVNPFWQKDAIELLPGRIVIDPNSGVDVMQDTTRQGVQLTLTKQWDIKTSKCLYRMDTLWGVVNKQPEMSGIMLFSQS